MIVRFGMAVRVTFMGFQCVSIGHFGAIPLSYASLRRVRDPRTGP